MQPWLSTVAAQLPFHALAVHSDQLDKIREEEVGTSENLFTDSVYNYTVHFNSTLYISLVKR